MDISRLKSLLHYDPDTGKFYWISGVRAGREAGRSHSCGYRQIRIDNKFYYAHRLAWFYMTGNHPEINIDHIDGDRSNNRFSNLREVSHSGNQHNQRVPHKNSGSGLLGVSETGGRFRAAIKVRGRSIHIGTFDTAEEAHAAYIAKKRDLHATCTI